MLKLNPHPEIQASRVTETQVCVVIDDFLLNPNEAIEFAKARQQDFQMPERAYPGLVLPVDDRLMDSLYQFIRREMSKLFPFCRGGIDFHTQFALATLQPEDFSWIQRLCHTDPRLSPGRVNFAALVYLFTDEAMGGTGFYRWKDPEYLQGMAEGQREDPDAGLEELQAKYRMFREPPCYMTESNELAELLDIVPARFNRFVFYSGDLPHSAFIREPGLLSGDPDTGRLTLNCFISALPK